MKKIKILFSLILLMFLNSCSSKVYKPLEVVNYVDIQKYQGLWHEIARLPNSFQEDCFCSTAEYNIIDSSTISVRNECREDSINGEIDYAEGKAFVVEGSNNAKLEVQFFWPFRGDYWIIDLDELNYQYAVVGTPSRKYLWILSRESSITDSLYSELINKIEKKDFDISKIIKTEKSCFYEE